MEFHVTARNVQAALAAIEGAIFDIDPDGTLRVAAALDAGELAGVLSGAGLVLAPGDIHQLPSICCGGCSG